LAPKSVKYYPDPHFSTKPPNQANEVGYASYTMDQELCTHWRFELCDRHQQLVAHCIISDPWKRNVM